jgi:hypothetical protein
LNSSKISKKKLTSADPHTEAVATVQMIDVALLEVTEQAPVPTATDVGSFRLVPTRAIVRVSVVEHPRTWRSAVDDSPQETVLMNGLEEQMTPPRLGLAEAQVVPPYEAVHGLFPVQVVILEPESSMSIDE